METVASRKINSLPPLMLTLRQSPCALMFLGIGQIALSAISTERTCPVLACKLDIDRHQAMCSVCWDWARVEEDSRRAIQLDQSFALGHYLLGLSFQQRGEHTKGIKELERALDLGRGVKRYRDMIEWIWEALGKAKYLEWELQSTKRMWDLRTLKEACEFALKEKLSDEATIAQSAQLELLGKVFMKAAEDDTPTEVPDYLCCRITLAIFRDPVITPSGVTYEREAILDHLRKVGKFDPITRKPLCQSELIPNLAIKAAVQVFLDKHGWAYTMD